MLLLLQGICILGESELLYLIGFTQKKNNGKFLIRIEDTDRKRSSKEAINIILEGLEWLGLNFDDTPIYQNNNIKRHREIVQKLLNNGNAYKCWASKEELTLMKNKAEKDGSYINYNGLWRDKKPSENEEGKPYTVRFKSEQSGETIVNDNVQGDVKFQNNNIEDFINLLSKNITEDKELKLIHKKKWKQLIERKYGK